VAGIVEYDCKGWKVLVGAARAMPPHYVIILAQIHIQGFTEGDLNG